MAKEFSVMDINEAKPTGKTVGAPDLLWEQDVNPALLHEIVKALEGNWRQGTHSTLTRSEVRGGGRKPWKQKHTGRARAGSNTSPLWRKGGIAFGPKPRSYETRVPQAKRRTALAQALRSRLDEGMAVVTEDSLTAFTKTKEFNRALGALGAQHQRRLVVVSKSLPAVVRYSRNIPGVSVKLAQQVNARDVLAHQFLLVSDQAWEPLMEAAGCGR
ncbi:MAG: 50S ribosomal protein L4 [Elusimicrobia bacterium]|nr:50S ribosomal protein L4 [Elusimicrobiota bacterium]